MKQFSILNSQFSIFLLLCLAAPAAKAQVYIGVHGGVTLPSGFYADSKMSDYEWMLAGGHQLKGGAGKGFSAGIDVAYAMPFLSDLSVILEAEFMQSEPNADVKKYHEAHNDIDHTLPKYRNIPILAGVRYSYPIGKYYDLYGEALGGVNIRSITPYTYGASVFTYDNATTMAFRLGAGVIVRDLVSLGASFSMMGKAPLEGDYSLPSFTKYTSLNPTMVSITLGFRINPFKGLTRHVQDF